MSDKQDYEGLLRSLDAPMWRVEPVDLQRIAKEAAAAIRSLIKERDDAMFLLARINWAVDKTGSLGARLLADLDALMRERDAFLAKDPP